MECKETKVASFPLRKAVLIETSWNVKRIVSTTLFVVFCINRNIVECKGPLYRISLCLQRVLIETSWNVKEVPTKATAMLPIVLIETSWNVKNSETELVEFLKEY